MSHVLVERALASSRADHAVAIASATSTVNLRWANSSLTTNGATESTSLTVISMVGRSFGSRSATIGSIDDVDAIVRASEAAAREAAPAEDYQDLVPGTTDADFEDPAGSTGPSSFTALASALGRAFLSLAPSGASLFGFARHEVETVWLGTSTGVRRRHVQPTGAVEWNAKDRRPMGSVWLGQSTSNFTDVDVDATVQQLCERLSWVRSYRELPAGRYEVLLPPSAVADLMVYAYWVAAGRDAHEGRTAFSLPGGGTRVGERVSPHAITLASDPLEPGLGTVPFVLTGASSATTSVYDNGLPLARTEWIRDGVLSQLVHTRASAAATGERCAPAIENLVMDAGGTSSVEEMVAATERGLLLTCLWYIREVDPLTLLLTGLTRDGVYVVEDGEVVGAANNFRFNESPLDLLERITEIGASERTLPREWSDYFTLASMPPVRVPDFNMSSVSAAS